MRQVREDCKSKDKLAATDQRHAEERSPTHCTFGVVQITVVQMLIRATREINRIRADRYQYNLGWPGSLR